MRPTETPRNKEPGFSLIELMISSAIIFFFLLGLGQLLIQSSLLKYRSDGAMKSAEIASSKLEELRSCDFEDNLLQAGEYEASLSPGAEKKIYHLEWSIQVIQPDLKQIIIECHPSGMPLKRCRIMLFVDRNLGF